MAKARVDILVGLILGVVAALAPAARAQDAGLNLSLDQFGVGGEARRGDWAGIRLAIIDAAPRPRNLVVRVVLTDSDGDHPSYQRVVATNPGVRQHVWFYVRVPQAFTGGTSGASMMAEAYEAGDEAGAAQGQAGVRSGRLLARIPLQPALSSILGRGPGVVCVVGSRRLGLEADGEVGSGAGALDAFGVWRAEVTRDVHVNSAADLPDSWLGLAAAEAIVWASADLSELRGERARAVRDWVMRGGHLVIALPPVGQTITNRESNELYPIMPVVSITRHEGVDLRPYRPLLVGATGVEERQGEEGEERVVRRAVRLPERAIVHTFAPAPDAGAGEAIRVLDGPDGRCVVVRRLVGVGAVTLVGFDLGPAEFSNGSLSAQAFWHRVLGKGGRVSKAVDDRTRAKAGGGQPVLLDWGLDEEIRDKGSAAGGLLLGLVIFVLYWLLAGPIGFALLKRRKLTRHAWVGFFAVAAGFTALSWMGATSLRPHGVQARHVSVIDHVFGQGVERGWMWAGVMLPSYGEAQLRVDAPVEGQAGTGNAIAAWEPLGDSTIRPFLDTRAYVVDGQHPDAMRVPTRATVKEVALMWSGGPVWKMPGPLVSAEGAMSQVRWEASAEGAARLSGVLVHELPGTLRDVKVVIVRGQESVVDSARDLPFMMESWDYSQWPAKEPLDLSKLEVARGKGQAVALRTLLDKVRTGEQRTDQYNVPLGINPPKTIGENLLAWSLASLLPGPRDTDETRISSPVYLRGATQGLDISRWLTQPCLIVMGSLEGGASPVPLLVDGKPASSVGTTYVRWIYPLADNPPAYRGGEEPAGPAADTAEPSGK